MNSFISSLKTFYKKILFAKVSSKVKLIKNNKIYNIICKFLIPSLALRFPNFSLNVEVENKNIFLHEDDKKYKILSRNRFERYVLAGGFEEVGLYLAGKYQVNNLKDIKNIVEIGPNIGELSLWLINYYVPKKILLIDGDPLALSCLKHNMIYSNKLSECHINEGFVSNKEGDHYAYLDSNHASTSLYPPKTKNFFNKISIKCKRGDEITKDYFGEEIIDLLKIEAEGFEPEVLIGFNSLFKKIKYITLDCGPERGGLTTYEECSALLEKAGYKVKKNNNYLFAEFK